MTEKYFTHAEIMALEQRYRATFINALGGFKSVCLIGTKSTSNTTNLAIFSSVIHIGSNPPLIGFIARPASSERHTIENILDTKYYTINHINENIYRKAHQTSARYKRNISEFEETDLSEKYNQNFFAPFVNESKIQIGMEFKEKIDFAINGTSFIIGEIREVYFPDDCLQPDGFLDLEKANTITCSGLDSYHKTEKLERLPYAKPL